ncbi:MAG: L-2-hydroxyglutarate oxidase [Gammaproteobacteria bacterium]
MIPTQSFDVIVIGGGIVGLASAYSVLEQNAGLRLVVIEKENTLAAHQTGRNSGVIHSGLYYKPGSLKAQNCRNGYKLLLEFCAKEGVAYEICGKIVVATKTEEFSRLEELAIRGKANGLSRIRHLSESEIKDHEPHCAGRRGLFVPETGIIDYKQMCEKLAVRITALGGEIRLGEKIESISSSLSRQRVSTRHSSYDSKVVVVCAGLQADRLASKMDRNLDLRILPFRGEYFSLKPSAQKLVKNLIYPTPDPAFPFLGVHFTRMIDGSIECGPNAVLALAREGYLKTDFSMRDILETITWPGFRHVARRHWRTGLGEYKRSIFKSAFVTALQRLVPEITKDDLVPAAAGIRAQACSRDGGLLDDFEIRTIGSTVHICNAPSPAATASLSIGQHVALQVAELLV